MSKAEEYSFNIPSELFQQLTKEQQVLWRKEIENAFNNGYQQAEKDNELTLKDVEIIINAFLDFCIENKERGNTKRYTNKEYSQEILKRFKERKQQ